MRMSKFTCNHPHVFDCVTDILRYRTKRVGKNRRIAKYIRLICGFKLVRLAAHVSKGLKSRIHPVVGRIQPKARVSIVRWNLKEAGCEEHTNSLANLWSDEQKSHMRLYMRVRLPTKPKPNNYTESCMINEADR